VDAAVAITSTYVGRPMALAPETLAGLGRQAAGGDPLGFVWSVGYLQALMVTERYDEATAGFDAVIGAAREHGTPSALPWPLAGRAEVRRRTGRLRDAAADATEGLGLAEDTGQANLAGYALAVLALLDAMTGRDESCRARAQQAIAMASESDTDSLAWYADGALGLMALSASDLESAGLHFGALARRYRAAGDFHPLIDGHEGDMVEVLIRADRRDEALTALAGLERNASRTGAVWPAAAAARCRGLMAGDDGFEEHFAEAVALHGRTETPFEHARTLLCLGERRRRARRVRDAREPLAAALDAFEGLGAAPWAEWARRELRATGTRTRQPRVASHEELTPQELQVALTVAEGATNKAAATALLISPKTVEYHLAKVYAKLGVRSRAELAARIAREGPSPLGAAGAD
jgi:DNA-binding CsgD family transcriptional regulator